MSTQAEREPRSPQEVIAQSLDLGSRVQAFFNQQPLALVGTITSKRPSARHTDLFFVRWDTRESGWYTAAQLLSV